MADSRNSETLRPWMQQLVLLGLAFFLVFGCGGNGDDGGTQNAPEPTAEEDLSPGIKLRIESCGYHKRRSGLVDPNRDDDDSTIDDDDDSAGDDDDDDTTPADDDDSSIGDDDDSAGDDDDSAGDDDDSALVGDDDDSSITGDDDDSAAPGDDDDSAL